MARNQGADLPEPIEIGAFSIPRKPIGRSTLEDLEKGTAVEDQPYPVDGESNSTTKAVFMERAPSQPSRKGVSAAARQDPYPRPFRGFVYRNMWLCYIFTRLIQFALSVVLMAAAGLTISGFDFERNRSQIYWAQAPAIIKFNLFLSVFSLLYSSFAVGMALRKGSTVSWLLVSLEITHNICFFSAALAMAIGYGDFESCSRKVRMLRLWPKDGAFFVFTSN
jgi:hypothetical protein